MPGFYSISDDFHLPVDSEHKGTRFRPWSVAGVHMIAFHMAWLSFFAGLFSNMSIMALQPVISRDLRLTDLDMFRAGVAMMAGAVAGCIVLGVLCDTVGPRTAQASILLLTGPIVCGAGLVTNLAGFAVCRFLVGMALGAFVVSQYWSSVMFNVKVVGQANATVAGFGSTAALASKMLVPLVAHAMERLFGTHPAWRYTLCFPGAFQMIIGMCILQFGQDMPDGSFWMLRKRREMGPPAVLKSLRTSISNYRTWVLVWICAFAFGVQITTQSIIIPHLPEGLGVSIQSTEMLRFALVALNIFSRVLGGYMSDAMACICGMKGRLISLWVAQTISGLLVVVLGFSSSNLVLTVVVLGAFSVFGLSAKGAIFGIVPFVSKRGLGVVNGLVGAGGVLGAALLQGLFLQGLKLPARGGLVLLGLAAVIASQVTLYFRFPQWGGIITAPEDEVCEEDYYLDEFTHDEIASGGAHSSLIFAVESRSQRQSPSISSIHDGAIINNSIGLSGQSSATARQLPI